MINIKFGNIEDLNKNANAYIGIIPAGITTKQDLLKSYAEVFKFPEYFGFNGMPLMSVCRTFIGLRVLNI